MTAPLFTKLTWYIGSEHVLVFELMLALCLAFILDTWRMFRKALKTAEKEDIK